MSAPIKIDPVETPEFDHQCSEKAHEHAAFKSSEGNGDSDDDSLRPSDDSAPYEVPKIEAILYYAGVGPKGRGPKLIYRTSDDKFEEPHGLEAYARLMRVVAVPDSHEFGQDGMWDMVRDRVVELLNKKSIRFSSVDFVRFTWLNKKADHEIEEEDDDDDGVEHHYTNPTIWIGILPETLIGAIAHESSKDIRAFLTSLLVQNINIAYRESVYKTLLGHGPALSPPVKDGDPLKDVTDNVSVPLSLPIAGCGITMQGTLGPYFRAGNKLYAITVRHNVFLPNGDNELYKYHQSEPKKEVLVMGTPTFTKYLAYIQLLIDVHIDSIELLETKINALRTRVQDQINVQESQNELNENEAELAKMRTKLSNIRKLEADINMRWSKPQDRVIGFVRWAPPIGAGVAPHRYTRDLCVIELYKEKFKHMIGNVLSLGPELSAFKLYSLMYECSNVPPKFEYPGDGLLPLRGMLTADQVNNPNTLTLQGDRIRRVLKRGFTTKTTVGTHTRFMSFIRLYSAIGNVESLEVPIFSHEHDPGTFSKGGDSGSLIVSAHGEFVALLTGGTNYGTDGSDITYATLFEWVWDLVKEEFPDANLDFDNLQEFLADVA